METKYDLSAMRNAISQCDVSIKIFEEAIKKENRTKEEYLNIIKTLENSEKNKPKITVELVVEKEGD